MTKEGDEGKGRVAPTRKKDREFSLKVQGKGGKGVQFCNSGGA